MSQRFREARESCSRLRARAASTSRSTSPPGGAWASLRAASSEARAPSRTSESRSSAMVTAAASVARSAAPWPRSPCDHCPIPGTASVRTTLPNPPSPPAPCASAGPPFSGKRSLARCRTNPGLSAVNRKSPRSGSSIRSGDIPVSCTAPSSLSSPRPGSVSSVWGSSGSAGAAMALRRPNASSVSTTGERGERMILRPRPAVRIRERTRPAPADRDLCDSLDDPPDFRPAARARTWFRNPSPRAPEAARRTTRSRVSTGTGPVPSRRAGSRRTGGTASARGTRGPFPRRRR